MELTDANFDAEVLQAEGLVMVDFWAVWCGPCRTLAPIVDEVAKSYEGKVKVGKFDIENGNDIPAKYGIRNIPTLLFFKNGELVDKSTGLVKKNDLAAKIDSLL